MKTCPVCESVKNLKAQNSYPEGMVYTCKKCTVGLFDGELPKYAGADIEENSLVRFFKRFILSYEVGYLKKRKPMRVLEIGSGSGELANLLSHYGHDVTCNDIDEKSLERISSRMKLKTIFGHLERLSIRDSSFDMVILRHTFEHIDDPARLIKSIRNLLTKNGRIIVTLPNYDSYCRKIIGKNWSGFSIPSHRYFWTEKSLKRFLRKNEFGTVKAKTLFSHFGLPLNLVSLVKNPTLRLVCLPIFFAIGGSLEVFFTFLGKGQNLFIEARKL